MRSIDKEKNISWGVRAFALAVLGVPFSGGSLSLMYYYPVVIIVIGMMALSLCKEKFQVNILHFSILILCGIMIWHLDTSLQYFEEAKAVVGLILFFIFFFLLTMHKPNLLEIKLVCRCFGYSGIIISILLLIFKQEYEMGRYSYPIGGHLLEVNYLACYLSITFLFMFHKVLNSVKSKKLLYGIGAFLILYAIFLTGSRAAFLSAGVTSIILLFYNPKNLVLKILLLISFFVLGLMILPQNLTDRFLHRSYNDGSNQMRLRLFKAAWELAGQKPFVGYGIAFTGIGSAHNTFLSILLNFGFIGLLMYIVILFRNFSILLQRDMFLFLAIFVDLFITSMIITNYNTIPFWFSLVLLTWVTEYKNNNPHVLFWREI